MPGRTLFVTGTDTGVGKTVVTALLVRHFRHSGIAVAALKPLCSGGRGDARVLRAAVGRALTLDEINPWHFRAPLAPLLAARREGKRVRLGAVLEYVRSIGKRFELVLVEGAGGLLSPLGEDFNARDLIGALRATPIIVCPNRLGAVNQTLLTMAALPRSVGRRAQVVLAAPSETDEASRTNQALLGECLRRTQIHILPWLRPAQDWRQTLKDKRVNALLAGLLQDLSKPD
ncbi:MAG TPA: dethiobiotin synthase [Verrucomicrobiae bacterium]|nr:dethiobiotin synthase [Verrucomicrobiae bacterium]